MRPRSRGVNSRGLRVLPSRKRRAQGMPDATTAPPRPRVQQKTRELVTTGTPEHRHSLHDGFTAYTRETTSECTHPPCPWPRRYRSFLKGTGWLGHKGDLAFWKSEIFLTGSLDGNSEKATRRANQFAERIELAREKRSDLFPDVRGCDISFGSAPRYRQGPVLLRPLHDG